jgi:membrane-bound serine protease (ClpP class)
VKTLLRLLALLFALSASLLAQPTVVSLTLHDTIQPVSAGYLSRGLAAAAQRHAVLVVVSLDTPGGLLDSTREMVAAIEHSPVPVAIWVAPAGARAASAGFFLLESADIAAMAPGTNTGAAHPIVEGRTLDPVLKQKIENDAAAFLRSYAGRRGHNAEAAEDAVRNSKSYSDTEALQLHLVDLVVPSTAALLSALDGRTVHRFDGSATTLHLAGATVVEIAPSLRESLLTRLTNPDVAILLLIAGMLLIYLEFNVPGTIIPGALGSLSVLLALFGLGMLPISHVALLLLMAAGALFLVEIKVPSHGVLGLAGVAALVFGLATLVDGPITEMRVHRGVAVAAGIGFGGITLLLAWVALQARRNKFVMGPQAMVNKLAIAQTDLQPSGQVEIRGELWRAILAAEAQPIPAGTEVVVRGIELDGLTLIVEQAGNVQPTVQKS